MEFGQGLAGDDYLLIWTAAVAAVMVVGLFGVVLPFLPGLFLILAAAVAYGFLVGFSSIAVAVLVAMGILVVISIIKSFIIPSKAAAESGASGWSQFGAVVGGVTGFFIVPVFGLIIGALAGMVLTELAIKGNWDEAWTATKGAAKGFGISALIDLGLGTIMIAAWSVWAATVVL